MSYSIIRFKLRPPITQQPAYGNLLVRAYSRTLGLQKLMFFTIRRSMSYLIILFEVRPRITQQPAYGNLLVRPLLNSLLQ